MCRYPAKKSEVRPLIVDRLVAVDTAELDTLKDKLEQERHEREAAQVERDSLSMKLQMMSNENVRLSAQLRESQYVWLALVALVLMISLYVGTGL